MFVKFAAAALISLFALLVFSGCGASGEKEFVLPDIPELGEPVKTELCRAECFSIYDYRNGDSLIVTDDGGVYLISEKKPEGLDDGVVFIRRGTDKIYMAASAVMSFFDALGRVSDIRFSALEEKSWEFESARGAMSDGDMIYAGKYRDPDYELLLKEGCSLSIQSTMSGHVPKVRQKLTEIGIPVFVDRSSYEPHPLGRCEWIKVYARMTGETELGDKLFEEQKAYFDALDDRADSGKTAVFFYISASGRIVTRKSGDYVTKMIEMAGGENVFDFIGEDNASSSVTLEPEQFCIYAKDADIIFYNANLGGEISSVDELLSKYGLLREFKAVRNGDVWCTGRSVYQDIMKMGEMLSEFHSIFFGETDGGLKYFYRLG
ncbi:MAG: ABC transporter substrate-binding protein [Clostridiales bacterium]|nr:ABC transporter substrate-binding protein [Clostridiales bacterium]